MDFANFGAKKIIIVTDTTVAKLDAMRYCTEALDSEGIKYVVYDKVRVEPKDTSIKEAIAFSLKEKPDAFLAVGGGSVIDTAKLMNLYTCCPGTFNTLTHLPSTIFLTQPQKMTSSTSSTPPSAKACP